MWRGDTLNHIAAPGEGVESKVLDQAVKSDGTLATAATSMARSTCRRLVIARVRRTHEENDDIGKRAVGPCSRW